MLPALRRLWLLPSNFFILLLSGPVRMHRAIFMVYSEHAVLLPNRNDSEVSATLLMVNCA
jgi:hypothetical protein